jgi:uncharacterized protein YbaR (Trm112 family)
MTLKERQFRPWREGFLCPNCDRPFITGGETSDVVYFDTGRGVYLLCAKCRSDLPIKDQIPFLQNMLVGWMSDFDEHNIYRKHLLSGEWTFDQVMSMFRDTLESYDSIMVALAHVERATPDEATPSGEAKP